MDTEHQKPRSTLLTLYLRSLGNGINQKGSLVAPDKLRFDFSHKSGVTDAELEKIESISTDYIRQNSVVYSKDVPLATAKEIQGVRAVFGETYPDPVRVVSVGVELEEILKDVKNPQWDKVSIEFCGGTHVQKTGDIKDLIITEESGIAKGIRRMIALTGEDAHRVQKDANDFDERLSKLEKMQHGPEKDAEIKQTKLDLPGLVISAVTKSKFRDRFAKVEKAQLEGQKAQTKAETKKGIDTVTEFFTKNEDKHELLIKLPISGNSKVIGEILNSVKTKNKDKSVYLFAPDKEGKVVHGCYVSEVSTFPYPA